MRARGAALAGSVVSGALASACCIGPLVLTLLGVSGGALAHRLEPLRPLLLVSTYGLLTGAFSLTYRPGRATSVLWANDYSTAPVEGSLTEHLRHLVHRDASIAAR
jgi:hypothetical protein